MLAVHSEMKQKTEIKDGTNEAELWMANQEVVAM